MAESHKLRLIFYLINNWNIGSLKHYRTLKFQTQTQKKNDFVQNKKQHHGKVMLSSFNLNGKTSGFHLQTQKIELY